MIFLHVYQYLRHNAYIFCSSVIFSKRNRCIITLARVPAPFLIFKDFLIIIIIYNSLLRRPLGHWFESNLCSILTGTLFSILIYAAYLYISNKKGVVYMLISSLLYIITCFGTSSVAQRAEQVAT